MILISEVADAPVIMTDLLYADASPLMQSLKKALPSGSFACYIETEGPDDAIVFIAQNVNPQDSAVFRKTVDAALADVAKNGFAQDLVDGLAASLSLSMKLLREGSEVGVDLIPDIAYSYSSSGDPFNYMDYMDALEQLDDWNSRGLYKEAVEKWLVGSKTTTLTVTYPEPGLREQLDEAEAQRLAAVKEELSAEELSAIIETTNAPQEEDDASAYVSQLQAVTVASLPEESRAYTVTDETGEDGVRRMTAEAGVDGVGQVVLLLDTSGLPQEDIHWFALYTALLGELDTSAHSSEGLAALTTRYLYSGEIRLSLVEQDGTKNYNPYLRAGWIASDEDLQDSYDLMYELLYDTQFTDTEMLLGLIQQNKASLKSAITSSPYNVALYRAFAESSPLYAYYDNFNYLNYYAFLERVEQAMAEEPDEVVARLEAVQTYFHNRTNAVAAYAGSDDGIQTNAPIADAFLEKLDAREIKAAEYEFTTAAESFSLIVDSNVQYNGIIADYDVLGMEGYSADMDAVSALVNDAYLLPMLRDQYGVYTPWHGFVEDAGIYLLTYRDPNITETFEVYEALSEFLADMELDQETLDGYILSSYAYYAIPDGELSGAVSAILDALSGTPADQSLQYMRQLKALTPDKAKACVSAYEKLMENGIRVTAGGAATISANEDLYEEILNPFDAVDSSGVEFSDVPEGHEFYEAVHFAYEYGLLEPLKDEVFGVDEKATLGEFAGALYGLFGGDPAEQKKAIQFFGEYDIMPYKSAVSSPVTAAQAQDILDRLCQVAELDFTPDESAPETELSRGELAVVLMAFVEPLL